MPKTTKKKKLVDNILSTIENKKIKPTPRLFFTSQNIFFWSLFSLCALIGAASVSVILYVIFEVDFDVHEYFSSQEDLFIFLLSVMPVLWILSAFIFFNVSSWGLQKTKRGYQWAGWQISLLNVLISLILGGLFYAFGLAETVEDKMTKNTPYLKSIKTHHRDYWSYPETTGRVAGKIEAVLESDWLELRAPNGKLWRVFHAEAEKGPALDLEAGNLIKARGKTLDGQIFKAEKMGPHKRRPRLIRHLRNNDRHLLSPRSETLRNNQQGLPPEIRSQFRSPELRSDQ